MKILMLAPPPELIASRKQTGADRWDEVWGGVLHMPPMPNRRHQDLVGALEAYLRYHWAKQSGGRVYHEINVSPPGGWPDRDYRIPDLLLLTPQRLGIDRDVYFEGAPEVVVEIHSPGDEAYEKLAFYADLGVPEVWVIHRDSLAPEVYLLRRGRYRKQRPAGGWHRSPATGVELRVVRGPKLAIRMGQDDATRELLPED